MAYTISDYLRWKNELARLLEHEPVARHNVEMGDFSMRQYKKLYIDDRKILEDAIAEYEAEHEESTIMDD